MRFSRWMRAVAIIAAAFAPVTGPALAQDVPGFDPQLVAAARSEGHLTLYTSQNQDLVQGTVDAFQKTFPGIEVRTLRLTSGPMYSRLTEEMRAGVHEVDVIGTGDPRIFLDNPDWWMPLDKDYIPTITNLPASAINSNFVYTSQAISVIAYNTDMLSTDQAPKTWQDILKPEFKGKGLFIDPRSANTYMNWLDLMDKLYGDDYLKQLGTQEFPLAATASPGVQEIAAGNAEFIFPVNFANILPIQQLGAPLGIEKPHENSDAPGTGAITGFGVSKFSTSPNAARLYLTWLLTADAQKVNCGGSYASLALPKDDIGQCQPAMDNFVPQIADLPADRQKQLLDLIGIQ